MTAGLAVKRGKEICLTGTGVMVFLMGIGVMVLIMGTGVMACLNGVGVIADEQRTQLVELELFRNSNPELFRNIEHVPEPSGMSELPI